MKNKPKNRPSSAGIQSSEAKIAKDQNLVAFARTERSIPAEPSKASIRERAYMLYETANCCHGHDKDHWIEATAQLKKETLGDAGRSL